MEVLLIDTIHPLFNRLAEAHGVACVDGSAWSRDAVLDGIGRFDGLVVRSRIAVDRPLLERAGKLRFIARAGAGMENIDVAFAESRGIACLNAPEGNRNAVAEHALGMLLALFNNLLRADREVRQGRWEREGNRGRELDGKTVGIVGFGHTGSAFARKLAGFDVTILAYDKYAPVDTVRHPHVRQASMDALFEAADVLSLHVPLTAETDGLVDDAYLKRFARPVTVVNTSRGRVVRLADLVAHLQAGTVAGACLDVFDFEDASFERVAPGEAASFARLKASDRVVLSPHIAGWTIESAEKIARVLAEKIAALPGR